MGRICDGCRASGGLGRLGDQGLSLFQINTDQLADTLLGHCDAEQAIHPRHRHSMVRDDQEARFGAAGHLVQHIAETGHVGIVQRRIHLVQHTDWRRIGQEDRKDKRKRGKGLFPPRQQ